jgi:hypothetical protein
VPFESIRREEFEKFLPPPLVLNTLTVEQVEWFANQVGNIIGTIAGKTDKGWSYAVLKGDRRGNFRVCNLGGDSYSFEVARSRFLLDMEAAEKAEAEIARLERRGAVPKRRL